MSNSNVQRHKRNIHQLKEADDEEEEEVVNEEPDDDDSDHEMKSEDDEDPEEEDMEEKAWRWLLERVYKTMDFSTEQRTPTEILRNKVALKDIASKLRNEVEDVIKFGVYLHDESPLYQKLTSTKNKLIDEEDYDEDEATVKAWKNRKFIIYQQIKENDDVLKDFLEEEGQEDEEEGDTKQSDSLPT